MNFDTKLSDPMTSVQESVSFAIAAIYQNNLEGPDAMTSFAEAHLNASLVAYGNCESFCNTVGDATVSDGGRFLVLGVAARVLYFEDAYGLSVQASYHSMDEQRIYVSGSVARASTLLFSFFRQTCSLTPRRPDVLFILLILMALAGSAVLRFHHEDRRLFKLYSAPGSVAHAISIAATSDLPSVLRPTDTASDMRSSLQEYTFTLNRETGGLVMGDRDPAMLPNSPTHLEMMNVRDRLRSMSHGRGP